MLRRRPERKARSPVARVFDDFKPSVEWVVEPENYLLIFHLPGFKNEELITTIDKNGKMTIKGTRQIDPLRFVRFEESQDLPKDSNLETITSKLENGYLSLTIQKTVSVFHKKSDILSENAASDHRKEEEEEAQKEFKKLDKGEMDKEKSSVEKEMANTSEGVKQRSSNGSINHEKVEESNDKDKLLSEKTEQKTDQIKQRSSNGSINHEKVEESNEKDKLLSVKTEQKTEHDEKEEAMEMENITEQLIKKNIDAIDERKEEALKELPEKEKQGVKRGGKRRRWPWNEEDEGFIDNVLKNVYRNRKLIALTLVAFSTGFYISRKLRARG